MTVTRMRVAGETVAVTRRTILRKYLWGPWDDMVAQILLYSIAAAVAPNSRHEETSGGLRGCPGVIHQITLMPTHLHLLMTCMDARLSRMLTRAMSWSSKALNKLMSERKLQETKQVWDHRQPGVERVLDWEGEFHKSVYQLLNPVQAGLVERHGKFPGLCTPADWMRGHVLSVKRPPFYFSKRFPEQVDLYFGPPPQSYIAYGGDVPRFVADVETAVRDVEARLRAVRKGRVIGSARLKRQHPHDEPNTLPEKFSRVRPNICIGTRDPDERRARFKSAVGELRGFRVAHEEARERDTMGVAKVEFPFGTDAARHIHRRKVTDWHGESMERPGEIDVRWLREFHCSWDHVSSDILLHEERPDAADREARRTQREAIADALFHHATLPDKDDAEDRSGDKPRKKKGEEQEASEADDPYKALSERNLQPSAKKRPSVQPPRGPTVRKGRYGERVQVDQASRVVVRRDLLPKHERPTGPDASDDDH